MPRDQTTIDNADLNSAALAPLTILQPNGDTAQLGDQWADHPIVLALVRHFG